MSIAWNPEQEDQILGKLDINILLAEDVEWHRFVEEMHTWQCYRWIGVDVYVRKGDSLVSYGMTAPGPPLVPQSFVVNKSRCRVRGMSDVYTAATNFPNTLWAASTHIPGIKPISRKPRKIIKYRYPGAFTRGFNLDTENDPFLQYVSAPNVNPVSLVGKFAPFMYPNVPSPPGASMFAAPSQLLVLFDQVAEPALPETSFTGLINYDQRQTLDIYVYWKFQCFARNIPRYATSTHP